MFKKILFILSLGCFSFQLSASDEDDSFESLGIECFTRLVKAFKTYEVDLLNLESATKASSSPLLGEVFAALYTPDNWGAMSFNMLKNMEALCNANEDLLLLCLHLPKEKAEMLGGKINFLVKKMEENKVDEHFDAFFDSSQRMEKLSMWLSKEPGRAHLIEDAIFEKFETSVSGMFYTFFNISVVFLLGDKITPSSPESRVYYEERRRVLMDKIIRCKPRSSFQIFMVAINSPFQGGLSFSSYPDFKDFMESFYEKDSEPRCLRSDTSMSRSVNAFKKMDKGLNRTFQEIEKRLSCFKSAGKCFSPPIINSVNLVGFRQDMEELRLAYKRLLLKDYVSKPDESTVFKVGRFMGQKVKNIKEWPSGCPHEKLVYVLRWNYARVLAGLSGFDVEKRLATRGVYGEFCDGFSKVLALLEKGPGAGHEAVVKVAYIEAMTHANTLYNILGKEEKERSAQAAKGEQVLDSRLVSASAPKYPTGKNAENYRLAAEDKKLRERAKEKADAVKGKGAAGPAVASEPVELTEAQEAAQKSRREKIQKYRSNRSKAQKERVRSIPGMEDKVNRIFGLLREAHDFKSLLGSVTNGGRLHKHADGFSSFTPTMESGYRLLFKFSNLNPLEIELIKFEDPHSK